MNFQPISKHRVYEIVIQQIQEMIEKGELKRGDRLPPERKITEELNISRASLREAFSALELVGIIETRPREGTFIKKESTGALKPLTLAFLLDEDFDRDFLELRRTLEVEAARLAALRASKEDLMELGHVFQQTMNASDEEQSIHGDKQFHKAIAKISGNTLLQTLVESISEVVDRHIEQLRVRLFQNPADRRKLLTIHEGIFQAISERDPEAAEKWMKAHYQFVEERQSQ